MKKKKKHSEKADHKIASTTGRFEQSRSGMGFVIVPGEGKDILVKPENINQAFDGDEVQVEILQHKGNRLEGSISKVLKRKQEEFTGKIELSKNFAFFIPDNAKLQTDFFIPLESLNGAANGDYVVAKMIEWPKRAKNPVAQVLRVLNNEDVNERAMLGILMDAGFPLEFPEEVLTEANQFNDQLDAEEIKRRRDFRATLTMTIDPVDAKDFDDALSIRSLEDGWFEVGVHIADVSYYMPAGGALDKEALKRATSVYLPDRVLPMLPEHLSNYLCSLRPDEEKFSFSAVFVMNAQGKMKDYWLGRTVIKSNRRFTYEEVQEMIEGAEGNHKAELMILNGMARKLREERMAKGAINFSSEEVRFVLDEKAKPIGITIKESKEAHQLIEEFMLLANKKVAEYVSQISVKEQKIPFPYRIHDVPDEEKLQVFSAFAARYGHRFDTSSPEKIAASFNDMLQLVAGKPEQHVLETLGIRTMAKAVYSTENIGHYGLGFKNYCHFTSPIRRYPDVMVHRILQEVLDGRPQIHKETEQQCDHCSSQERKAMEAERSANKYKQVEFLQDHVGEDFDAVVSGVATFGFWAETVEHKCEGLVPIQELTGIDEFQHHPDEYALVGQHTGLRIRMGDKVKVKVAAANLEKRQIDFALVALMVEQKGSVVERKTKGDHHKEKKHMHAKDKAEKAGHKKHKKR